MGKACISKLPYIAIGGMLSTKYKYLFRLGRGPKAIELFGPSIGYFWNDIYDAFDIERQMTVQKLDRNAFSEVEIKRLFKDLAEDMEEDFGEIWLEVQNEGKRLLFIETNILPGVSLDEQQEILNSFLFSVEKPSVLASTNDSRSLYFESEKTVALLVYIESKQSEEGDGDRVVGVDKVKLLVDKRLEIGAERLLLVVWQDLTDDAKSFAKRSNVEVLNTAAMLKEINATNLDMALESFQMGAGLATNDKFTKERFRVYFDLLRSARSNMAKKDSLENLSKYLLNGIKGFHVIDKDYRGPSEEFDLIVANENTDAPLKSIGNPLAVECRHRKAPATSKDIRDFCGKLTSAGLKAGILISLKGITGNQYDAIGEIREARKKNMTVIVVTLEELIQVNNGRKPVEIIRDCFYKYI